MSIIGTVGTIFSVPERLFLEAKSLEGPSRTSDAHSEPLSQATQPNGGTTRGSEAPQTEDVDTELR
jgi:hypothetical protein